MCVIQDAQDWLTVSPAVLIIKLWRGSSGGGAHAVNAWCAAFYQAGGPGRAAVPGGCGGGIAPRRVISFGHSPITAGTARHHAEALHPPGPAGAAAAGVYTGVEWGSAAPTVGAAAYTLSIPADVLFDGAPGGTPAAAPNWNIDLVSYRDRCLARIR